MRIYHLKRTQVLPITLAEAWDFFSSPKNLAKITPSHMKFKILYISGGQRMYAGQLIRYKINVLPNIPVGWTTEITQVNEPYHFVDTQVSGPYSLWHHQHFFREVPGGVEMIDEVNYAIPFGPIGWLANALFVEREVNRIFDYRFEVLEKLFPQPVTA
jgi:ligand-binding SRPBCC domain-containing protein